MSSDTKDPNTTPSQTIETLVSLAKPEEASEIVEAFKSEYEKYYGKYVDKERLKSFVEEMRREIDRGQRPDEKILTVTDREKGEFIGAGAIKYGDRTAELGSTIIEEDHRGKKNSSGRGVYDELFVERLEDVSKRVGEDIDLVYTQLLADKSAATQNTADKHGFAVTGVYDKKFPVAYKDKGRVTVVDMLWADSNFTESDRDVYLPEDAAKAKDAAIDNINRKRSEELENLTRKELEGKKDRREASYRIESKAVDTPEDEPMNFAEVSVVADDSGDSSWQDVIETIERAESQIENAENDYWVGVSLDVNDPVGFDAAQALADWKFEYTGFNPEKLDVAGGKRDALELQHTPSRDSYVKEFIDEAKRFMDRAGMDFREAEANTGYSNSKALRI